MPPDEEVHAIASNESPHPEVLLLQQPEPQEIVHPHIEPMPLPRRPRGIAPLWHTLVLVLGILAFSVWGAVSGKAGSANPFAPVHNSSSAASNGTDHVRVIRYGLTGTLELFVVAWVAFGLRLRKIPFRSLFGVWPRSLNDITKEAGIAAAFWICSLIMRPTCL